MEYNNLHRGDTTTAIIQAIAAEDGRNVEDVPSLYTVIDTDALNKLCEFDSVEIEFTFNGYAVHVGDSGVVSVSLLGKQ